MKTNGKSFTVKTYLKDSNGNTANFFGFDWNCGIYSSGGACSSCQISYIQSTNTCSGTCDSGNSNCACYGTIGKCTKSPLTTHSQAYPMIIVVKGGESTCPRTTKSGAAATSSASFLLLASCVLLNSILGGRQT
jgi:hypothetical protein